MSERKQLVRSGAAEFEEAVGGRANLVGVLENQNRDTKQDILFRLISDPARKNDSLVTLCHQAGVTTNEILGMFRDAVVAKSMVEAQMTLAERLGNIAMDVAQKAVDHTKPCRCAVLSEIGEADPECPSCGGRGEVYLEGSLDHAKVAMEAAGLTHKGGGVNVNVQQNNVNAGAGALLEKFVKATDAAAFDVVEAEVIPEVIPSE